MANTDAIKKSGLKTYVEAKYTPVKGHVDVEAVVGERKKRKCVDTSTGAFVNILISADLTIL